MIKLLLIGLVWKFFKYISFCIITSYILIWCTSTHILSKEYKTAFSMKPIKINKNSNNSVFYYFYVIPYNVLFDITYMRLVHGNFYFLKYINIKNFIFKFCFSYYIFSYFLFRILIFIFKISSYDDLNNYLYKLSYNNYDTRIIINIDGKWSYNGNFDTFWIKFWKNINLQFISTKQQINLFQHLEKQYKNILEFSNEHKHFKTNKIKFLDKNKSQIIHEGHEGITKNCDKLGYQTEYNSAYNNNFYDKKPLIIKFEGQTKISTELWIDKKNIQIIEEVGEESLLQQHLGFLQYGGDVENLSKDFLLINSEYNFLLDGIENIAKEDPDFNIIKEKKILIASEMLKSIANSEYYKII